MKTRLGTVVIENIGGAAGAIGVAAVARAQPDGYTLILANAANMVVTPAISSRSLYDPIRDFEAVYHLASGAAVIAVHPSLPVTTLTGLVDHARKSGNLSYGSPGVGTTNHLLLEILKQRTATDITHIPYRGAGPLLTDVIGGQVPIGSLVLTGQVLDLHRSGKLRVLAVMSPDRVRGAPELPTAAESGFPDLPHLSFFGLFAPKGTSLPIRDQIAIATRSALREPDVQQLYIASGFEPDLDSSPQALTRLLEERTAHWAPIIKAIGVKLD